MAGGRAEEGAPVGNGTWRGFGVRGNRRGSPETWGSHPRAERARGAEGAVALLPTVTGCRGVVALKVAGGCLRNCFIPFFFFFFGLFYLDVRGW